MCRWLMNEKFTSPHEIAQLNIEHYRSLLKTPLDEQTRLTVERLLAAEKAKLADLAKPTGTPPGSGPPDCCGADDDGELRR